VKEFHEFNYVGKNFFMVKEQVESIKDKRKPKSYGIIT